jgi:hypothetical protein
LYNSTVCVPAFDDVAKTDIICVGELIKNDILYELIFTADTLVNSVPVIVTVSPDTLFVAPNAGTILSIFNTSKYVYIDDATPPIVLTTKLYVPAGSGGGVRDIKVDELIATGTGTLVPRILLIVIFNAIVDVVIKFVPLIVIGTLPIVGPLDGFNDEMVGAFAYLYALTNIDDPPDAFTCNGYIPVIVLFVVPDIVLIVNDVIVTADPIVTDKGFPIELKKFDPLIVMDVFPPEKPPSGTILVMVGLETYLIVDEFDNPPTAVTSNGYVPIVDGGVIVDIVVSVNDVIPIADSPNITFKGF